VIRSVITFPDASGTPAADAGVATTT